MKITKLILSLLIPTTLLGADKYTCNHYDIPYTLISSGSTIQIEYEGEDVKSILHSEGLRFWTEGREVDMNTKKNLINGKIPLGDKDREFIKEKLLHSIELYTHCVIEHKPTEVNYRQPNKKY